jgi:cephalosporin-C deacetylase
LSPNVTLEADAFYYQPEWDVYRMRYSGAGGHRLHAWLSVPRGNGPFPALVRMPDYASVHDIIYTSLRHRAVVMNATHRGQRNSDASVRSSYPGLLTEGIESAGSYHVLGAFADALRAIDALRAQEQVAVGAVALTGTGLGGSLALAAASRRSGIAGVAADTPMPLGHPAALQPGLGYPLAELGDYLRMYPDRRVQVEEVLSVLRPLEVASSVSAPVLLSVGRFDRSVCPLAFGEELASSLPNADLRVYDGAAEGGGHEHAEVRTAWLGERLDAL